jgi:hypothetical protein
MKSSISRCQSIRRFHEMERRFIDLIEIERDGEFCCPAYWVTISSGDYSGLTYNILDVKTKVDEIGNPMWNVWKHNMP